MRDIWSPKKAFHNRKQLNWPQMVLVFLTMTLLLAIPVYRHYQQIDQFSLRDFFPNTVELIDEETIALLNEIEYENGEMHTDGLIAVGLSDDELLEVEGTNSLVFESDSFTIGDETGRVETIAYTDDFSLSDAATKEEVIWELSRQYTAQNGDSIIFYFTLVLFVFIVGWSLFIVLVYAYLLTLLKDFTLSDIRTYKEAVNLILNLLALPTIAAFVYGLYQFNLITMLAIQITGLILMLVILYRQTKFQDVNE